MLPHPRCSFTATFSHKNGNLVLNWARGIEALVNAPGPQAVGQVKLDGGIIHLLCLSHKGKEAHPRLDHPFDEAMVLLDQVLEVFDLPQFDLLGKLFGGFEFRTGLRIGRVLIYLDHTRNRRGGVGRSRGLFHPFFNPMGLRS